VSKKQLCKICGKNNTHVGFDDIGCHANREDYTAVSGCELAEALAERDALKAENAQLRGLALAKEPMLKGDLVTYYRAVCGKRNCSNVSPFYNSTKSDVIATLRYYGWKKTTWQIGDGWVCPVCNGRKYNASVLQNNMADDTDVGR
jgi:hypothetical protein